MTIHLARLVALLLLAAAPAAAQTDAFPTRTITVVVPYPAGGATDVAVRPVVERLAAVLGQSVVIENVGGGGSTIGTGRVARAAPDGYTLLGQQVSIAAMPALFPKLPFDVEKSLTGVALINTNPSLIVGRANLPANTWPELVAWMKSKPGEARIAHAGAGTMAHLCAAVLARAVGAELNIVPYRGGNAVNTDIIGGHVDLFCSGAGLVLEHVKAGTMKPFAVTSREPYEPLPNLPTVLQLGLPELEIRFWQGLFAPAGTPKPIIDKLNAAVREALRDPAVLKSFRDNGMSAFPPQEQTPEAATALWLSETKRWGDVIRANNITVTQQ